MGGCILASFSSNARQKLNPWPMPVQIYAANSTRTDLLLLIGAIYYQLGNYEQCIAFNDRCILLDPGLAESHANLANALQQIGNFDMAIVYYQVRAQAPLDFSVMRFLVNQACHPDHCAAADATARPLVLSMQKLVVTP